MNNHKHKSGISFTPRLYWREILAILMILLAIFFFKSERKELDSIIPNLKQAKSTWLFYLLLLTVSTIFFQGGIYHQSFKSIQLSLKWLDSIMLFLKRNFISVFLPAGGVSALAYSPSQLRKLGYSKAQVHQASGLFGFAGLLTVFMAGLPVVVFVTATQHQFKDAWISLLSLLIVIVLLLLIARSIKQQGVFYRLIQKIAPRLLPAISEIFSGSVNTKIFSSAVAFSLGVELCGMLQVYVAMLALGVSSSFAAASAAYIISITMMSVSPFLRGLGAVELTMVLALQQFGYSSVSALSITLLYRVFEFWLPMLAGLLAFAWKGKNLFLRLAPALLSFMLGIVNIISAVTAPIHERMVILHAYIPLAAIHASVALTLFIGFSLLLTAAFLFRGMRNAWYMAVIFAVVSLVAHLTKALDYEEAIFAMITLVVLLITSSQYPVKSSKARVRAGAKNALLSLAAALIFGFIGFYFIDIKHFGEDFTWRQSLLHTCRIFFLMNDSSLHAITKFGQEFLWLLRMIGFSTWSYLLISMVRPLIHHDPVPESDRERVEQLLKQFGRSANDYFKAYKDKAYFFSQVHEAFVAYRTAKGFAIVLEEPVCEDEFKVAVLIEFDEFCRRKGLTASYYRVDENSLPWFEELKKHKIIIGQEAIIEIDKFTLEGKEKKSLRNGLNGLQKKGYVVNLHVAPQSAEFLKKLQEVSDEWLSNYKTQELVFAQGMFDEAELKMQDIVSLEDDEGNVKAFLNIIPDYAADEYTYDLIRKTADAPTAAMDALIVKLIEYAKEHKQLYINLGLVPMLTDTKPGNTAEQLIKLAAEKIRRFQHYKGLKEFKEKYATIWENKYLVYNNDFDLLKLPLALDKVMKP